jgi:ATP-dependent DNA ligase
MAESRVKLHIYPDKPLSANLAFLDAADADGSYLCEQKVDGFRMVIDFLPHGVQLVSRHGKDFTSEISREIIQELEAVREGYDISAGTRLDGEWRSRRSCSVELDLPQKLFIFDIMRWGRAWLTGVPLRERRYDYIQCWFPEATSAVGEKSSVTLSLATRLAFRGFFEAQKKIPWSEGVVLKHLEGYIQGGKSRSESNPTWHKVKYRGGIDGDVLMEKFQ